MVLNTLLLALLVVGYAFWRGSFHADDVVVAWCRWSLGVFLIALGIAGSLVVGVAG
ncbi:hypothetical protein LMK08_16535 [Metapseudomonas furukawaii]|uniref:hypothetical protein n=1 Tax=Metapseudomonas furukawaii TaxID=1149133 RepID=UPI00227B153C|nr:hypothetical protein [Pseudomonas furukawaii]WAG76982.1 hypothetical protein LMK08_16535 [Pseudomonas furukawaii]